MVNAGDGGQADGDKGDVSNRGTQAGAKNKMNEKPPLLLYESIALSFFFFFLSVCVCSLSAPFIHIDTQTHNESMMFKKRASH